LVFADRQRRLLELQVAFGGVSAAREYWIWI
jgi:hypothetical protein